MEALKFISSDPPKGFKSDAESFLFNTEIHRHLQSENGWVSFYLLNEEKKKILAEAHFHINGKLATSPLKAPFGGPAFSKKLTPAQQFEFLQKAEAHLSEMGVTTITIKMPPHMYHPAKAAITEVLLMNLGYNVTTAEIGAAIVIDKHPFEHQIDSWELRKLKQAKKEVVFREVETDNLAEIYNFILECRTEREQSLSMNLIDLQNTIEALPNSFSLFGVYKKKELVAASIGIRVSKKIFYNFYSAHPKKWDSLSPVVALTHGLYSWCNKNEIELLDLGTSALNDVPNFGLLDFKIRLGGVPTPKLTFTKSLR